jgi:hypothetical protein
MKKMPRKNRQPEDHSHTPDSLVNGYRSDKVNDEENDSTQDEFMQETPSHHLTNPYYEGEQTHEAGRREVELYIRTYNTLLRSSGEVSLKALVQAHYNIDSSLHLQRAAPACRDHRV